MAWVKKLDVACESPGCCKRATREVFTALNATLGKFCTNCSQRVFIRMMKREAATSSNGHRARS